MPVGDRTAVPRPVRPPRGGPLVAVGGAAGRWPPAAGRRPGGQGGVGVPPRRGPSGLGRLLPFAERRQALAHRRPRVHPGAPEADRDPGPGRRGHLGLEATRPPPARGGPDGPGPGSGTPGVALDHRVRRQGAGPGSGGLRGRRRRGRWTGVLGRAGALLLRRRHRRSPGRTGLHGGGPRGPPARGPLDDRGVDGRRGGRAGRTPLSVHGLVAEDPSPPSVRGRGGVADFGADTDAVVAELGLPG